MCASNCTPCPAGRNAYCRACRKPQKMPVPVLQAWCTAVHPLPLCLAKSHCPGAGNMPGAPPRAPELMRMIYRRCKPFSPPSVPGPAQQFPPFSFPSSSPSFAGSGVWIWVSSTAPGRLPQKPFPPFPLPGILKCVLVFSRSLALSSGPNNVLPTFRFPPPLFVIHDPGVCAVFRFRDPKLGHAVGSSDDVYYYIGERLGASSKGGRVAAHTASSHQLLGDAWSRR